MANATLRRADTPARAPTPLALIALLARKGARGTLTLNADGTRALTIACDRSPGRPPAAPYTVFVAARDAGWIESPGGDGVVWTLTPLGRASLRRTRSAGGGEALPAALAADPVPGTARTIVDAAESPLAWLRRRKDKAGQPLISAVQFDAGERLRGDLYFAEMSPRVTANWSATPGTRGGGSGLGIDMRDGLVAARQRVGRALGAVGAISAGLLLDVCGHLKGLEAIERDRGWPPRSGKIALQMALSELARYYGLPGAESTPAPVAARLRHWGVPDYRPAIDGAE